MIYSFEWDKNKAITNFQKHKISFEDVASIFNDPLAITIFDKEHSEFEERWITLGITSKGQLAILIHTYNIIDEKNVTIRIISARKATKNEIKTYKGDL